MATLADLAEEPAVQLEVRGPPVPIIERYYTKHYAVGEIRLLLAIRYQGRMKLSGRISIA